MTKSFRTQSDFRAWLERHHAAETELILRLFKVHARHRGIGYREALDEALCFGWIDGVRRSLDEDSFTQRFTPRRAKSAWSNVNIKRFRELEAEGRVRPPGIEAFRGRDGKPARYSFQVDPREMELDPAFVRKFQAKKRAWKFYSEQPPGYRRLTAFWVMDARRAETRAARFELLLKHSALGERIPAFQSNR